MTSYSPVVETARDYYNSADADAFYSSIWGGEDIHIGIYAQADEPIFDASRRTVERMARRVPGLGAQSRVLDIGAGYGGAARFLAARYGCRVIALNLSEVENDRARVLNKNEGVADLVEVVAGSFEEIPYPAGSFDVVWSQDAILHSGNRAAVVAEVARVLAPGGQFVFTDIMAADDCPDGVLGPILERIHLDTLGSPAFYRETAGQLELRELGFEDHTDQLPTHYARVLDETQRREGELAGAISSEYLQRMKKGLGHWVDGGRNGYLTWGIFDFQKPAGVSGAPGVGARS